MTRTQSPPSYGWLYTTQGQVRDAFWRAVGMSPIPRARQNDYDATIRSGFCDFVDAAQKDGAISEALAQRVTL